MTDRTMAATCPKGSRRAATRASGCGTWNGVASIRAAAKLAPELTQFRGTRFAEYSKLLPQHRPSQRLVAELREFVTAAGPALADVLALADYPEGRLAPPTSPIILDKSTD